MTIYAVIPVFNRLHMTRLLVECLRLQKLSHPLSIIVVNDGSTDDTAIWLTGQSDIQTLNGDGALFWGGAVDLAMQHLRNIAADDDWVLLMNNDTTVSDDFVQCLLEAAMTNAPAAVGSVIRDEANHAHLLSIGANVDAWRFLTHDILDTERSKAAASLVEVDALSGRGVLFQMKALIAAGGMRPRVLPHYLADYELSIRMRKSGWRLLVLLGASVYSCDEYGSSRRELSFRDRFFSIRSPLYLPAFIVFWWEASNWFQRLTLPLRLPLFAVFPRLRKPKI